MECPKCEMQLDADGTCWHCTRMAAFVSLAESHGLPMFPDPTGERYVYNIDGTCAGKKGECVKLIDMLWNALAKASQRPDLMIQ